MKTSLAARFSRIKCLVQYVDEVSRVQHNDVHTVLLNIVTVIVNSNGLVISSLTVILFPVDLSVLVLKHFDF